MDGSSSQFLFEQFLIAVRFLWELLYIWLPVALVPLFIAVWLEYRRAAFMRKQGEVLLEIKLSREIRKSPQAMEFILTQMYQKGSTPYDEAYIDGKIVPNYSLELVSIEGEVRFYIWTGRKMKDVIEAQIYAQYPSVEVFEAEDYTLPMKYDPEGQIMWGTHFKLSKDDAYPIKTYVDFELDKNASSEYQETVIDPLSSTIEYLGSLKKGEQTWIQILIQAHRSYGPDHGHFIKKPDWIKDIDKKIEEIHDKYRRTEKNENPLPQMTEEDKNTLKALARSKSKYAFDTCIRGIYFGKMEAFNAARITGLIGAFRQYDDNSSNGFKLGLFTDFDYPWQDFRRMRRTAREKALLDAYKKRSYYQGEYKHWTQKPFILTTEELATIFHLPGDVVSTPTLDRIGSRKAEAPGNLPT